ncbi:MAG: S8 family serine peptidase [Candidatus Zixiibacteriota bacterium]
MRLGAADVQFADLPLSASYVSQVLALGGTVRRVSRWLNAASFDISIDRLADLAALPMVAEVRPVAVFRRPFEVGEDERPGPQGGTMSGDALDYGQSQAQIYQINVATAHAQGLTGRGVALTMTDTGYRKTHAAVAGAVAAGRVLAEYDFVMNDPNTSMEPGDSPNQWNHGTLTWSVAGGYAPGRLIGPAYGADFILCKTEDITDETQVEEDNWVAALEFADSIGTDVISTSLGYSDWYTYSDMDGRTAVITLAANTCDALGIVLVVSAGNAGYLPGTISAPADAFDILAAGAVNTSGFVASFSSRGPTFDGRIKPEVCALGVDTYGASASGDQSYAYASGTSLSAPLIAGAACLLIEARPELTARQVREALKATATRAASPDNSYGWGTIDLGKALTWPVAFSADTTRGQAPLTVTFANSSLLPASALTWDFGDGALSDDSTPAHEYADPGIYNVSLTIGTEEGQFTRTIPGMVLAHSDSLALPNIQVQAGSRVRMDVYARNFLPVNQIEVPFSWDGPLGMSFDSFSTAGLRTSYFPTQSIISIALAQKRATISLRTPNTEQEPALAPGSGPVVSLWFRVPLQFGTATNPVTFVTYGSYAPSFRADTYEYVTATTSGSIRLGCCIGIVGDVDGDGGDVPTIADVTRLVDYLFITQEPVACLTEADVNQSGGADPVSEDVSIVDATILIDYLFVTGPSLILPTCP